jgi:biopolymer transport protein ExbD
VDKNGNIFLNTVPMDLDKLLTTLVEFRKVDPDLNVVVRGDSRIHYQKIINVLDVLVSAKIEKVGLATETFGQ